MIASDRQAFIEIVLGFAELKGKTLSAPALTLYWQSMQHWPLSDFRSAAEQLLRTCQWMPVPKDFEDLRKAGRPTAGEAWAEVIAWCASGSYRDSELGDEAIDRAVAAMGGYRAIAVHEEDKLHFLERRFAEHYEAIQDAIDTRVAVPQIAFDPDLTMAGLLQRNGPRQQGLLPAAGALSEAVASRARLFRARDIKVQPAPPRPDSEDPRTEIGF